MLIEDIVYLLQRARKLEPKTFNQTIDEFEELLQEIEDVTREAERLIGLSKSSQEIEVLRMTIIKMEKRRNGLKEVQYQCGIHTKVANHLTSNSAAKDNDADQSNASSITVQPSRTKSCRGEVIHNSYPVAENSAASTGLCEMSPVKSTEPVKRSTADENSNLNDSCNDVICSQVFVNNQMTFSICPKEEFQKYAATKKPSFAARLTDLEEPTTLCTNVATSSFVPSGTFQPPPTKPADKNIQQLDHQPRMGLRTPPVGVSSWLTCKVTTTDAWLASPPSQEDSDIGIHTVANALAKVAENHEDDDGENSVHLEEPNHDSAWKIEENSNDSTTEGAIPTAALKERSEPKEDTSSGVQPSNDDTSPDVVEVKVSTSIANSSDMLASYSLDHSDQFEDAKNILEISSCKFDRIAVVHFSDMQPMPMEKYAITDTQYFDATVTLLLTNFYNGRDGLKNLFHISTIIVPTLGIG